MSWQPIPSVTQPHYLDATLNQVQKCVNWYHEKTAGGFVVRSFPGYKLKSTVANNQPCRGVKVDPGSLRTFSAHGDKVYSIDSGGAGTALAGSLTTSSGDVVFAVGLGSLFLVDGSNGYVIDPIALTVTQVTDVNFPALPVSCACINGQFIAIKGDSDRWYMSAVGDGLTWTPVISGRAITNGDQIYHVEVIRDTVYFMGRHSIEPWYPSPVDPYLQPVNGATIPVGIVRIAGVCRLGDLLFFYASGDRMRGSIWMISGGQASDITPPYIKDNIGDSISGGATRAFAFSNQGSDFFVMQATSATPSAGAWGYNITSGTWFETAASFINHAATTVISGLPTLAFSSSDGSVFYLGNTSVPYNILDTSGTLVRTLDFKVDGGISRIFTAGLRFELEVKHDSSTSFTLSMTLQKSDDGGRTFDTGITLSKAITNGTSAQKVILQSPPLGAVPAGRIYRTIFTGLAATLIFRRAEGLVRVGRF